LIRLSGLLYFNACFIEEFRCEVRSVGPFDCARVGIDRYLQEEIEFLQWLENIAVEFSCQVYFLDCAIAEPDPKPIVINLNP